MVLSTPVLVLPRSSEHEEVLVANLGKISIYNTHESSKDNQQVLTEDTYFVDIRNVNLYSLNNVRRKDLRSSNKINSHQNEAAAILYDTALLFQCKHESKARAGTTLETDQTLTVCIYVYTYTNIHFFHFHFIFKDHYYKLLVVNHRVLITGS